MKLFRPNPLIKLRAEVELLELQVRRIEATNKLKFYERDDLEERRAQIDRELNRGVRRMKLFQKTKGPDTTETTIVEQKGKSYKDIKAEADKLLESRGMKEPEK